MSPPKPTFFATSGTSRLNSRRTWREDRRLHPARTTIKRERIATYNERKESQKIRSSESLDDSQDVPESALPDPIPADSPPSASSLKPTTLTVTPTFSIPPLTSTASMNQSSRSTTTLWLTETPTFSVSPKVSGSSAGFPASAGHLPSYIFALAIGGSVIFLLSSILVYRRCIREKHKSHPTPSNPILQDSPLFGGKERFSRIHLGDAPFGNALYTVTNSANNVITNASAKGDGWRPLSGATDTGMGNASEKRQSKLLDVTIPPSMASAAPSAGFTSASSVGTAPPPFSPASVYTSAAPNGDIGLAIEDIPLPLPNNAKSLGSTQPLKLKEKETREIDDTKTVRRRSLTATMFTSPTITETEVAVAYSLPRPAPSPGKPKPALKSSGSSRDRLYNNAQRKNTPGPSPAVQQSNQHRRFSRSGTNDGGMDNIPTSYKRESFLYALPSIKSQERRDRDTKALTSALGLSSPSPQAPASACFSPVSLYPDDSLSVVDAHRHTSNMRRPGSEAGTTRVVSEMPSPTGTTAALGDLMLQEFPSTATFASMRSGERSRDPFADSAALPPIAASNSRKNYRVPGKSSVSDKPPRVPSPPPLPSLAQMALERSDCDYRSPTYSIYGLYEAERKSKTSLRG